MLNEIRDLPVAPVGQEYLVVVSCGWKRAPVAMDALTGAIRNGAYFKDDEPNWAHIVLIDPEDMDVTIGFGGANGPGILKDVARLKWDKTSCPRDCMDGYVYTDDLDDVGKPCPKCEGAGWLLSSSGKEARA